MRPAVDAVARVSLAARAGVTIRAGAQTSRATAVVTAVVVAAGSGGVGAGVATDKGVGAGMGAGHQGPQGWC